MSNFTHPSEPLRLGLIDGTEREFLLTMGGIRRLKTRFKAAVIADLLERDAVDIGVPLLYEALRNKGELTEEQFADLLPADLNGVHRAIAVLLGASFPEPKPTDPQPASPDQ